MGYEIRIGNAVPHFDKDGGQLYACWKVEPTATDKAPTFPNDEMTGNGNSRHPSYSSWTEFLRQTGLFDLFLGDDGLMKDHPGCRIITKDHHAAVKSALDKWQEKATLPPGLSGSQITSSGYETFDEGKYDHQLARLMWLEFWMKYAIDTYETPAIENY